MKTGLVWFRNNLRMDDNPCLNKALAENDKVILLYVYDERLFSEEQFGIERMGGHKIRFLFQSVEDLSTNLLTEDLYLHVTYANPVHYILKLVEQHDISRVYCQHECGTEEADDVLQIASKLSLQAFESSTLFIEDSLGFDIQKLPKVFTDFRKKIEKQGEFQQPIVFNRGKALCIELPEELYLNKFWSKITDNHKNSVVKLTGGETMAKERLSEYVWKQQSILTYKETRNNLLGNNYSSKFSPWLANGCISARRIYSEIVKFEEQVKTNESTYWLKFELLWREFFKWTSELHQHKLFVKNGIRNQVTEQFNLNDNFDLWANANTNNQFVNANMNELNKTGFMSNRGRQVVASYLIYCLKVDWRLGAAYFEKMLIDYDVASNYGNWIYIAGVGNDLRGGREFDVEKQSQYYDPNGEYVKQWANTKS